MSTRFRNTRRRKIRRNGTKKTTPASKHLVLLSTSDIKTSIVKEIFNRDYNLHFVKVPDNPDRPTQPLFLEGTKEAANSRFDEYFREYQIPDLDPDNTIVISIENGITPLDSETGNPFTELHWADFCVIGVCFKDVREFIISPEIIAIDTQYTKEYFKDGEINAEFETLGKFIVNGTDYPDNNWMKYIAGIDRREQIRKGLISLIKKLF